MFPWLVTGHDNAVTTGVQALDWIRLKTLHQDCLSLTRLYDRLEGEGCKVLVNGKPVDFYGIRDSFSHVAEEIAGFLNAGRAVKDVSDKIRSFISQMSADARNIYAKWDEFPQFRRCQLGAGVILEYKGTNTTVSDLKIQGSSIEIQQETCTFQAPDYSAFARYGKAWPFIIPDGQILAFVSVGSTSTSGILTFRRTAKPHGGYAGINDTFFLAKQAIPLEPGHTDYLWKSQIGSVTERGDYCLMDPVLGADRALPFKPFNPRAPDLTIRITIEDGWGRFHLYPIPFDAARGISDWKGCAMTTGMGTLGKDLKAIKDELSQLNRYTFDSDFWDGVRDVKDLGYSMERVKPSYIGLTEAPPNNIMP